MNKIWKVKYWCSYIQSQINFKTQLHAAFILYIAGFNTTNIFTWMWDEKQLRERYFSFVSNTCVICTRIELLGLQCSNPLPLGGWGGGKGTAYILMIGMIVVFLGVLISGLVFFRGCSSEIY